MFANKPNYLKLRTNLRLCINRLKLLEKKKTELALKARREIADYIAAGKEDRARIRVEHIIREDYLVEAMEIVEMLCDLLLARFGLIEKMTELDPGIEEAIATIIWVTPRMSADIQELQEVTHQLMLKYGKEFVEMCRRNMCDRGIVNEKVVHKMGLSAPPKILVENYMIEIAKSYKVPFEPDPVIMMGEPPAVSNLIDLGLDSRLSGGGHRESGNGNTGTRDVLHDNNNTMSAAERKRLEAERSGQHQNDQKKPPTSPSGGGGGGGGGGTVDWGVSGGARGAMAGASGCNGMNNNHGGMKNSASGGMADGNGWMNGGSGEGTGGINSSMTSGSGTLGRSSGGVGGGTGGGMNGGMGGGMNLAMGGGMGAGMDGIYDNSSHSLEGGVAVLPREGQFPPPMPVIGDMPPTYGSFSHGGPSSSPHVPPPLPSRPPNASQNGPPERCYLNPQMSWLDEDENCQSLPPYDAVISHPGQYPAANQPSPTGSNGGVNVPRLPNVPAFPDVPGLPSVPADSVTSGGGGGDDVNFDDLTRRFEELKRRK